MSCNRFRSVTKTLATCIALGVLFLLTGIVLSGAGESPVRVVSSVPSLTVWGKMFSGLLLATLGVAYLVWRRPVLQAQAILETSPLGTGRPAPPLVDWMLYLKTLLATEFVAAVGLLIARSAIGPMAMLDMLGVLGSGAIVALVVHLLLLARDVSGRRG